MDEPRGPNPPAHDNQSALSWRSQYLQERRKARMFMATTAISLVALVGTLAVSLVLDDPAQAPAAATVPGFVNPGDGTGLGGGRGQLGGVERFLNEDGTVDAAAVDETLSRFDAFGGLPDRFAQRMIGDVDDAVAAGTITEQQAQDLLVALGISGGSDA